MFCLQRICISTKAILLLFALLFLILNRSTEYTTRLDVYTKISDDETVYLYLPKAVGILIAVLIVIRVGARVSFIADWPGQTL